VLSDDRVEPFALGRNIVGGRIREVVHHLPPIDGSPSSSQRMTRFLTVPTPRGDFRRRERPGQGMHAAGLWR
jgi:hypothetical protein